MNKKAKDAITFAIAGSLFGGAIGYIGSCVYVAYHLGRSVTEPELTEVLQVAPWAQYQPILWLHSLYAIGALALVGSVIMLIVSLQSKSDSHGSARWATIQDMKQYGLLFNIHKLPGPIFAKLSGPRTKSKFISSGDIPHSLIAAPTGSGKGVGVVIPTLLTYPGSVICLDVKGENFEKTARRRVAMGDKVYKFSPFDPNHDSHRFNPIEYLTKLTPDFRFTEATRVAHSLLVPPAKGAEGFIESARNIFAATTILAIENDMPTIGHVYDILANGTPNGLPSDQAKAGGFNKMFERLAQATEYSGAKKIFTSLAKIEQKTLSAYISVLFDSGLGQWQDPFVRRATQHSDFTVHDLRENPASIFIVINPNDMKVLAPLTRLIFQQVVALLQRSEPKANEQYPVLLLMDEFASLGKMDAITQAMTTIRSYGGRFMIIVQSISNLKDTYTHETAQTYLANCRLQLYMAPADADTPEYVSKAIGDFTRKSRSKSWQSDKPIGSNIQERHEGARLLRPEDFRRLPDDEVVILLQGGFPVKAKKVFYYMDKQLKRVFESQSGEYPTSIMPAEVQVALPDSANTETGNNTVSKPTLEPNDKATKAKVARKFELARNIQKTKAAIACQKGMLSQIDKVAANIAQQEDKDRQQLFNRKPGDDDQDDSPVAAE